MTTDVQTPLENQSFWQRNWQKMLAVAIWGLLVGSFFAYATVQHGSPFAFNETLQDLVGLLQSPLGPIVYIVVYMLRPLAFFSAVVLTLLGGAIWGPVWGVLLTVVAANASAGVAYGLGAFLGEGLIKSAASDEEDDTGWISRYTRRMRENAFVTVLLMRLVYLPYDLVSYLAGFLRIPFVQFIGATALGSLAGTITFVLLGASLNLDEIFAGNFTASLNPWTLVFSAVLFVASIGLSRYFRQREEAKQPTTEPTAMPDASDNDDTKQGA